MAETLVSPHSSVAALRLDFNKIGTRGAVAVAVAVANLSLFDTAVGVAGAVALADAATANPESSLNLLHLGQNGLGDAAAIVLAKTIAAPNRRITSLDLCNNSIGDTGALALAEAIVAASAGSDGRPGRLKELNMGGNAITDVGAAALAKTLGVPNGTLVSLRLENNQVADGDILGSIDVVPAVRKVKKKGELLLNAKSVPPFPPPVGDRGAALIATAIDTRRRRRLRFIELRFNSITDEGIRSLVEAMRSPESRAVELDLRSYKVGDGGAIALDPARGESRQAAPLLELDLYCNRVGNAGGLALAEALNNPYCDTDILDIPSNKAMTKRSISNGPEHGA